MELWQIIIIGAFLIIIEVYICGVFFFAGHVINEKADNIKRELVAAFTAAILWPLIAWFYDRFYGKKSHR